MTTALATLLICIAGAALILAVATYVWVNRTPPINERFDRYGRVPLFGVEIGRTTPVSSPAMATGTPFSPTPPQASSAVDGRPKAESNGKSSGGAAPMEFAPGTAQLGDSAPRTADSPLNGGWGPKPGWPADMRPQGQTGIREISTEVAPASPYARPSSSSPTSTPTISPGGMPGPRTTPTPRVAIRQESRTPGANGATVSSDGVPGNMVEGHTLRFSVPAEGTLQFLPGRLEIVSGMDLGREIRFVRVPGPNGMEVTFGRNEGPLYRHIQLRDQTVSREHARMNLEDGRWCLVNLSRTNPVAINARVLGFAESQPLEDGDRVEMGEVVFNFRSR